MPEVNAGAMLGTAIKLFALMTPPAVLSAFLGYTKKYEAGQRRLIALKTSLAIFILGAVLYIWGAKIFELFGFTLDAFRIGSGVLLLLTALTLIQGRPQEKQENPEGDISIVPLAIPLGLGPASIGAVMVLGAQAENSDEMIAGLLALATASAGIFLLLCLGTVTGRLLGKSGISIMARLTGLLLAAIAAQVVFTGIANFLQ